MILIRSKIFKLPTYFGAQKSNVTIEISFATDMYARYLQRRSCCNDIIINFHLKIIVFLGMWAYNYWLEIIAVCPQGIYHKPSHQ